MITFFSIPTHHEGNTARLQGNAVKSWLQIPGSEVILFGEDRGVECFAQDVGARYVCEITKNEFGTPLVSDAFAKAQELSTHDILVYVNADIIFSSDLSRAVSVLAKERLFLAVGQRQDVDLPDTLIFDSRWEETLIAHARQHGILHGKAGMDYFIFRRGSFPEIPPFAVGRPGWDSWLLYHARSRGLSVIDATADIFAIHQNHPPRYTHTGPEAQDNNRIAGGFRHMATIRDATYLLRGGRVDPISLGRSIVSTFLFSSLGRTLLAGKRTLQLIIRKFIPH